LPTGIPELLLMRELKRTHKELTRKLPGLFRLATTLKRLGDFPQKSLCFEGLHNYMYNVTQKYRYSGNNYLISINIKPLNTGHQKDNLYSGNEKKTTRITASKEHKLWGEARARRS